MNARKSETLRQALSDLVVTYAFDEGFGPTSAFQVYHPNPGRVPVIDTRSGAWIPQHTIIDRDHGPDYGEAALADAEFLWSIQDLNDAYAKEWEEEEERREWERVCKAIDAELMDY